MITTGVDAHRQIPRFGGPGVGMVVRRTAKISNTFQAAFQIPGNPLATRLRGDAKGFAETRKRNSFFQAAFDELYLPGKPANFFPGQRVSPSELAHQMKCCPCARSDTLPVSRAHTIRLALPPGGGFLR